MKGPVFVRRIVVATLTVSALAVAPIVRAAPQDQAPAPVQPVEGRPAPKVGLALGGGAARGIAHIGVLRWFEEHRIPIDAIAGTSMGGLIGGAYASGLSPDEIQALIEKSDWDLMFLADSPFKYKTFRRKEDARAFPGQIDFGLKGGFTLPSGLNAGQQIELLLNHIALPYYGLRDFDDLPTPFRSVATDLRKSEPLVIGSGSFARALRATMAIPAIFTPVAIDDRLLVDGGVLNNVPADVVKKMGARVAIAVNVGSATDQPPAPSSLFSVLGQTLDSMMTSATRRALESADVVIVPDLKGLTGGDWRRTKDLVERGYQAAERMADRLLPYQVDQASYDEWMRARQARRRTATPVIRSVIVEGVPPVQTEAITAVLTARHVGHPLDREAVEDSILQLSGSDRYEVIGYQLRAAPPDGTDLVIRITPKSYGPPFLLPAVDLQNIDSTSFSLSLRLRVAAYDTPLPNSELRFDLGVGSNQAIGLELYKRVGHRGFFVAPRAFFVRDSLNGYQDGEFVAEYRVKRTGAGIDVGYTTGRRSEVRFGYGEANVRARRRVGAPTLPEASGSDSAASLRWVFDGQNSPLVPSRGLYVRSIFAYRFDTPDLVDSSGEVVQRVRDVPQLEAAGSWFSRIKTRERLFVNAAAGTSFGHDAGFDRFSLGGPLRIGSLNNDEARGSNYLLGVTGVLREWFRLPDVLGSNAYYGAWFEQGSAFDEWRDASYQTSISGGFVFETLLGPAFVGYSHALNGGGGRFYLAVGPFVR